LVNAALGLIVQLRYHCDWLPASDHFGAQRGDHLVARHGIPLRSMATGYIVQLFSADDRVRICQRIFWQIQMAGDFPGLPRFVFLMPRCTAIASTNRRLVLSRLLRQTACTAPWTVAPGPAASL
jgi:hypothetical protein